MRKNAKKLQHRQLRSNAVHCQDCIEGMKAMPSESVDMILTDPPYYLHNANNLKLPNSKTITKEFEFDQFKDEKEYLSFMRDTIKELYRVSKEGAAGYMFCSEEFLSYIRKILKTEGFKIRGMFYWHKKNPFPAFNNRKMYTSSVEISIYFSKGKVRNWRKKPANARHNYIELPCVGGRAKTPHKTQKPLKLCQHFIDMSSEKGELILDPFMGSGSTAIAALEMGRRFIGFEKNQRYCGYIYNRFSDWLKSHSIDVTLLPVVITKKNVIPIKFSLKK